MFQGSSQGALDPSFRRVKGNEPAVGLSKLFNSTLELILRHFRVCHNLKKIASHIPKQLINQFVRLLNSPRRSHHRETTKDYQFWHQAEDETMFSKLARVCVCDVSVH